MGTFRLNGSILATQTISFFLILSGVTKSTFVLSEKACICGYAIVRTRKSENNNRLMTSKMVYAGEGGHS